MTQQTDGTDETADETAGTPGSRGTRPPEVLQAYPPEAAPAADEDTKPVVVPGEQTDPQRRRDVFPEDGPPAG